MKSGGMALTVDPDHRSRALLRQASRGVPELRELIAVASLAHGLEMLERCGSCSLVFLSERLPRERISAFIEEARQGMAGRDAAYVVLMAGGVPRREIGAAPLRGADGFLLQPYCVEGLREAVELAARVRREHGAVRMKTALRLLVREVGAQIDRAAAMRRSGCGAGLTRHMLSEMCAVIHEFDAEMLTRYFETLLEAMGSAGPAASSGAAVRLSCGGASRWVSERVGTRALARIRSAFAA